MADKYIVKKLSSEVFRSYDKDNDGQMNRQDVRAMFEDALRTLGTPVVDDALLDRVVDAVDLNDTGVFRESEVQPVLNKIIEKKLNH